jgi:hypothetical protein
MDQADHDEQQESGDDLQKIALMTYPSLNEHGEYFPTR